MASKLAEYEFLDYNTWIVGSGRVGTKTAIFTLMFLLVCGGLFAQNVSLEQALQSSTRTIESKFPQGTQLAVLAFSASSQAFSEYIIDELAIAIASNNKVKVIDRQYMDVIRQEMNIQMSGDVSDDEIRRIGRQLGTQYIVTGSIMDVGNVYRFRIVAINVETAVREIAVSLNINHSAPQVDFLLTGHKLNAVIIDNFVYIEGGTFQMGSNIDNGEKPIHTVTVNNFIMGKYLVTQKEWFDVVGMTIEQQLIRSDLDKTISGKIYGRGDNFPMYYITWYEAIEYCNRRSLIEGFTPVYHGTVDNIICDWNANGYRLPTEAEWEYAAKGGNKDRLIYLYSGSNNIDIVAWYSGNSRNSAEQVGRKLPNSLGLYDMSGNVREWCWDRYGSYPSGIQTNPRGATSGVNRVARGGDWSFNAETARSTSRISHEPDWCFPYTGFRLVRNSN